MASHDRKNNMSHRLETLTGASGLLEWSIWTTAAIAVVVLLIASVEGVGRHLHGLLLAIPFILLLCLAVVRRRPRR